MNLWAVRLKILSLVQWLRLRFQASNAGGKGSTLKGQETMIPHAAKNNLKKNFFNKPYGMGKSGRRMGAIWSIPSPGRSRACFTKDGSILKQTLHYFKEVPFFTVF